MLRVFALALLGSLVPFGSLALAQQSVLVIVLADIGWEDLASAPTPVLDTMVAAGRAYTSYYTSPLCSPSRYQIQFGQLPHREFIGTALSSGAGDPDNEGASTETLSLASVLRAQGFRTACIGKWHVNDTTIGSSEEVVRIHGFQHWLAGNGANLASHHSWVRVDDGYRSVETTYSTIAVEDAFEAWWKAKAGPRFAVVNFYAAHHPFEVPPASTLPPGYVVGSSDREKFLASIMALDWAIGQMATYVKLATTTIFVVCDNGTPPPVVAASYVSPGYKHTQYQGGIRVPLLAIGAGVVPGTTSDLVQAVDFPATVLELFGFTAPGFSDSISFRPTLAGAAGARTWTFIQRFAPNGGTAPVLMRDDWSLVLASGAKVLVQDGNPEEVYDLALDPNETVNLAGTVAGTLAIDDAWALRSSILGPDWPY